MPGSALRDTQTQNILFHISPAAAVSAYFGQKTLGRTVDMNGNAHYTVAESPLQALKKTLFCGNIIVQKEAENKNLLPFFIYVFYSFAFHASAILMRGILRDTAGLISQDIFQPDAPAHIFFRRSAVHP